MLSKLLLLFQDMPLLALMPAALFGGVALLVKRRVLWITAAAWLAYALYELGVQARLLCSGECNIRADLLFIGPILLVLTLSAVMSSLWAPAARRP